MKKYLAIKMQKKTLVWDTLVSMYTCIFIIYLERIDTKLSPTNVCLILHFCQGVLN